MEQKFRIDFDEEDMWDELSSDSPLSLTTFPPDDWFSDVPIASSTPPPVRYHIHPNLRTRAPPDRMVMSESARPSVKPFDSMFLKWLFPEEARATQEINRLQEELQNARLREADLMQQLSTNQEQLRQYKQRYQAQAAVIHANAEYDLNANAISYFPSNEELCKQYASLMTQNRLDLIDVFMGDIVGVDRNAVTRVVADFTMEIYQHIIARFNMLCFGVLKTLNFDDIKQSKTSGPHKMTKLNVIKSSIRFWREHHPAPDIKSLGWSKFANESQCTTNLNKCLGGRLCADQKLQSECLSAASQYAQELFWICWKIVLSGPPELRLTAAPTFPALQLVSGTSIKTLFHDETLASPCC